MGVAEGFTFRLWTIVCEILLHQFPGRVGWNFYTYIGE